MNERFQNDSVVDIRRTIISARKEAGISQTELANSIGVRVATISDFECGKSEIRTDTLNKIINALSLRISTFYKNVFPSLQDMREDAVDTARLLLSHFDSYVSLKSITQDEMFDLTQKEHILSLHNMSDKTFEYTHKNGGIDYCGWYQYYRQLVTVEFTVLKSEQQNKK